MMDKNAVFWDNTSKRYDKQIKQFKKTYENTCDKIRGYVKKKDHVLDYGCGTGHVSIKISDIVSYIDAIDISSGMLLVAKDKQYKEDISNILFHQASLFDNSLKSGSFNAVLAVNIFHLLKDRNAVLKRINALLKPGGVLLSTTVCSGEKASFFNAVLWTFSRTGVIPYMDFVTSGDLEQQISDTGLTVLEKERLTPNAPNYFIAARK